MSLSASLMSDYKDGNEKSKADEWDTTGLVLCPLSEIMLNAVSNATTTSPHINFMGEGEGGGGGRKEAITFRKEEPPWFATTFVVHRTPLPCNHHRLFPCFWWFHILQLFKAVMITRSSRTKVRTFSTVLPR
jgi:hypothetical protein